MVFLDNASTTQITEEALKIYIESSKSKYYNPSALYMFGANVKLEMNRAKANILSILKASKFDNIIFTSGATEANNMVLKSFVKKGKKALIGISEHPSVYNVAKTLKDVGFDIEFVSINSDGIIDIEDFRKKITSEVNFVSIMHVNNETGAINPIKDLVRIAKGVNKNIIFHSDGVQAFGKINVDLNELGVDLYTISGHKIYGPKGIGALYVKKGIAIKPLIIGGGQENDLRSGTENTPAIFAFEYACNDVCRRLKEEKYKIIDLFNYTIDNLRILGDKIKINSKKDCNSQFIASFSLENLRAETILRMLEEKQILIGNGSACSSRKKGNRILSNMGLDNKFLEGSLRISFSYNTTKNEIDEFIRALIDVINEYKNKTNR